MSITFNNLPEAVADLSNEIGEIKRLLLEQTIQPQADPDKLLTIQQAAELLTLSVPTLYGYVHRAEIPVCKRGKRLFFSRQELLSWVKEGRRKTTAEISAEADEYMSGRKGSSGPNAIY